MGDLSDDTVIHMFRSIQYINILINDLYACISFSLLHVVMMVIFVGMGYLLIGVRDVLLQASIIIVVVVALALFVVLLMENKQAENLDELVNASEVFVKNSIRLADRKSMYWKFTKSCPPFLYIDAVHPFYIVRKDTFPAFIL